MNHANTFTLYIMKKVEITHRKQRLSKFQYPPSLSLSTCTQKKKIMSALILSSSVPHSSQNNHEKQNDFNFPNRKWEKSYALPSKWNKTQTNQNVYEYSWNSRVSVCIRFIHNVIHHMHVRTTYITHVKYVSSNNEMGIILHPN